MRKSDFGLSDCRTGAQPQPALATNTRRDHRMFKKRQRKAGQGAARRKRQHVEEEEEEEEEGEQAPREATTAEAGADEKAAAADPRAVGGEAAAGVGVAGDAGGGGVDGSDSDDWGGDPPSSAAADRAMLSDSGRSSSPPAPAAGGGAPADTETKGDSVLPIAAHRDEIVAAVRANQFIVLVGETGSGKTTQLAQFLLDAGLATQEGHEGGIAVTQPRRVAAIGAAHRVASERGGGSVGGEVGYTVRLESECSAATRIKFLTDGCLLRECLLCPTLDQYSVVILDEAHERSVATDLMFTLLKRAAAKRPNMRVVVTSATLDHVKFAAYFNRCPSIIVPGRQFPVEVHWESAGGRGVKTANLARSVATAVVNLHMQEPRGHILGFLTGQAEVEKACSLVVSMLRELEELGEEPPEFDIWIMPCYGAMTASQQADIFKPVPDTTRKVILATNIAETSITVDGIRFVVDGGFVKHNTYMPSSGMSTLQVQRISRVEAQQRAGRAGRTGPGKCIRLYSHKDHAMMDAESKPEIQRTSLEDVVLCCHLRSVSVPIAINPAVAEISYRWIGDIWVGVPVPIGAPRSD
jgi:HrpA-like RNA helicase